MRKLILASLIVTAAAASAPAVAAGTYSVRNDTGLRMTCNARRPRSEIMDRFDLRPGAEWNQTTDRDGARVLICYVGHRRQTFRMVSGHRYALLEADNGALWLRFLGGN